MFTSDQVKNLTQNAHDDNSDEAGLEQPRGLLVRRVSGEALKREVCMHCFMHFNVFSNRGNKS